MTELEKEAFLGKLIKPIGAVTVKPFMNKVVKPLFSTKLHESKAMFKDPMFAAMAAAPVLVGSKNIMDAAKEHTIPMYNEFKESGSKLKQEWANFGKMPSAMTTPTSNITPNVRVANFHEDGQDKEASLLNTGEDEKDDKIKSVINGIGISLGAGAGTYLLHDKYNDAKDTSQVIRGLNLGVDKAVGAVGKQTLKTLGKNKPITSVVANSMAQSGAFASKLLPHSNNMRLDFSTLENKPKINYKGLGMYLGLAGALNIGEELFGNYIYDKAKGLKKEYFGEPPRSARPPRDFSRNNGGNSSRGSYGTRSYTPRPYNNSPTPTRRPYNNYQKTALEDIKDELEKEALHPDTKRFLVERVIKPAATTGVALSTLAVLSRMLGRNLYGGFEKVRDDETLNTRRRLILDVPTSEVDGARNKKFISNLATDLNKSASILTPASKLEKVKMALDAKIQNSPKLRAMDNFMDEGEFKYNGKKGLSHFLVEELPFKTVEALSYASPMILTGLILNRNLKKGLEPIESEPGIPSVAPGTTRITLQDKPGTQEKKASTDELGKEQEALNSYSLAENVKDEIQALNHATTMRNIIQGEKYKQEKLAENKPILDGAKDTTCHRNIDFGKGNITPEELKLILNNF